MKISIRKEIDLSDSEKLKKALNLVFDELDKKIAEKGNGCAKSMHESFYDDMEADLALKLKNKLLRMLK